MTIIETLKQENTQYLKHCLDVLTIKTNVFTLDFSQGETDIARLLFIEKKHFIQPHALAVLTMRLLMFDEEWNDFKNYTPEDIKRWIGFLTKQYEASVYQPNIDSAIFKNNFFAQRLTTEKGIQHNAKIIDFADFNRLNPLLHEPIINVSKTEFSGLKEEFYIETSHHFVLFNWFTTA